MKCSDRLSHRFLEVPRCLSLFVIFLLAAPIMGSTAAELAPRRMATKSLEASLGVGRDSRTLVIKLVDDSRGRVEGGHLTAQAGLSRVSKSRNRSAGAIGESPQAAEEISRLESVMAGITGIAGVRLRPAFSLPVPQLEALRQVGQHNTGKALADLSQFFVLDLPTEELAAEILPQLLALPSVENAYGTARFDAPRVTQPYPAPKLEAFQGYRDPAPEGVGVDAALARNLRGEGVTVADVEFLWNLSHEDLLHLNQQVPRPPLVPQSDWDDTAPGSGFNREHGTANLGILAAADNSWGVTGFVPKAQIRVAPVFLLSDPDWAPANAVLLATLKLSPGDILLVEQERFLFDDGTIIVHTPFEFDDLEFAVVEQATALGIHVIQPAGNSVNRDFPLNGGLDLDNDPIVIDPGTGLSKLDIDFRDSGAVMVGGGLSSTDSNPVNEVFFHNRYFNSNFGTRVGTYAWGQNVTTTGYGPSFVQLSNCDSGNDPSTRLGKNYRYTHCYNGTSSAGAIVAGAAALLEQRHRQVYGQPGHPRDLRNLLQLGTASFGEVGHQPDLDLQLGILEGGGVIPFLFRGKEDTLGTEADFGAAVAGGRDIDGDGFKDFVVGQPKFDVDVSPGNSLRDAGRVSVFSGRTGQRLFTLDGQEESERFGTAVALGELVEGDGMADVVVGAPGSGGNSGRFAIFSGSSCCGAPNQGCPQAGVCSPWRVVSGSNNHFYGAALEVVEDWDDDGIDDLLVGAPGLDPDLVGRVEFFEGGDVSASPKVFQGADNDGQFGAALASGDVDGDEVPDLIIGAPRQLDASLNDNGQVWVYDIESELDLFCLEAGDSGISNCSGAGEPFPNGARFGASVDAADLDGDGLAEIVVGAPSLDTGGNIGKVFVFDDDDHNGAFLESFAGAVNRGTGAAVAAVGDFDGDQFGDIASGQTGGSGGPSTSRVVIHRGPFPGGPGGRRELVFPTTDNRVHLGSSLAAVGDVNGDGLPDLMAGEPKGEDQGRVFVFAGGPGEDLLSGRAKMVADSPVLEACDTNRNGFSGGGASPSQVVLHIDAGPVWGGGLYTINDPVGLVGELTGNLEPDGTASRVALRDIPEPMLCPDQIGQTVTYSAGVQKDLDGDGDLEFILTNDVTVGVISEFGGACWHSGQICR
ncbi:MAG: hypothetical protein K0U98_17390 [Deltaproteobacteria bacterium]|nr:hypothetical protein [Deltaproteobacteria bacterium]